jgi:Flp pilus assembly pilin Flp
MTEFVIILVAIAIVCICVAVQVGSTIHEKWEVADTELTYLCDNATMATASGGCP